MSFMILQIASAAKYVTDPNDQSTKYNIASRAILNKYFGATEDFIDPALTRWDIFNAKAELGTLDIEKENKLTIEEDLERTKEFYDDANDLGKKTEYLEQMRRKIITGVKEARDLSVDDQVESLEAINEIFGVSEDALKEANKGSDSEVINKAINDLITIWQGLSEKLYQETKDVDQEPAQENQSVKPDDKKKNDEVEEADFEEVK